MRCSHSGCVECAAAAGEVLGELLGGEEEDGVRPLVHPVVRQAPVPLDRQARDGVAVALDLDAPDGRFDLDEVHAAERRADGRHRRNGDRELWIGLERTRPVEHESRCND